MRQKSMRVAAVILYALSIGVGLAWWSIVWQKGILAVLPTRGLVILLGLGTLQVVGWALVFLLLRRSLRGPLHASDGVVLGISAGVLLGNLAWCITPFLGAPLIVLVTAVALAYLLRKS